MLNYKEIKRFIRKSGFFRENEKGSFTVEASLVFPIILLLTVAFILISVYIYERVYLYYVASITAERTTYSWNNSSKNPYTGEYELGSYDNLYWRLTDDQLFNFFSLSEQESHLIKISTEGSSQYDSLAEQKLQNSASLLPSGINGSLTYQNSLIAKRVTVNLETPIKISPLLGRLIGDKISSSASSTITDPVEFIRTIDLVITNKDRLNKRDEAKTVLDKQNE